MKLYNVQPLFEEQTTGTVATKVLMRQLRKLDSNIESLQTNLDLQNPNWGVVNKKSGSSSLCWLTFEELYRAGVVCPVIYATKDKTDKIISAIVPSLLQLHKGIVQTYGKDCIAIYDDVGKTDFEHLTKEQQDLVVQWELEIHKYTMDFRTRGPVYVIPDISAYARVEEGTIIFCDALEENEPIAPTSEERQDKNNYKAFLDAISGAMYQPSSDPKMEGGWNWEIYENGDVDLGNQWEFQLPSSPLRIDHWNALKVQTSSETGETKVTVEGIGSPHPLHTTGPKGMSYWCDFKRSPLCSAIYRASNDNSIEEIIVDSSVEYGYNSTLAKKHIPYYTLKIMDGGEALDRLPSAHLFIM